MDYLHSDYSAMPWRVYITAWAMGLPKCDVIHSHPLKLKGFAQLRVMTVKKGMGLPSLLATGGYIPSIARNQPRDCITGRQHSIAPARFVRNGPHLFRTFCSESTVE